MSQDVLLASVLAFVLGTMMWNAWHRPGRLPSSDIIKAWVLALLSDEVPHSLGEIQNTIATHSDLTEEQFAFLLPDGVRRRWQDRITKTLDEMHKQDLAYEMGPGFYRITKIGTIVAATQPVSVDLKYLRRFPDFILWEWRQKVGYFGPESNSPPPLPTPPTPAPIGGRMGFAAALPTPDPNMLSDPRNVTVWYGTNRKPNDPSKVGMGFSNDRTKTTRFGKCVVNIPVGHAMGETKPGIIEAWLEGTAGVVVKGIDAASEGAFWEGVQGALKSSVDETSVLFFLHGYNVSFLEAAVRTAQLKYDLKMPHGAFYSWPSKRRLFGYGADVASVEAAVPRIAEFLHRLATLTTGRRARLHIVAHSMGNLGLLLALDRILADIHNAAPQFVLADVVFAAPDMDAERFTDYVARTGGMFRQRTMYASRKDIPLRIAGWLRKASRAGRIPPVTIVTGTDTVDVSELDLSTLGHGYVAELRPVMTDIFLAAHYGAPPTGRPGLSAEHTVDGEYWVLA